ncbi:energy transducer TonB [Methylobacter sp. YRD-M1]|uniref:energy transducer TonB n=1 Tax=Methylobacter sp. YRD-M1 TaxID=2911520 RepID=UPI00227A0375|nr:energy transducer TonB [Methylobacter sp. YRD-M1]WAK02531.1 energy transducer TonB [Methylobacter sp. YRD-M1]
MEGIFPMYLFNNHEQGLIGQNLPLLGGTAPSVMRKKRTLFEALTGEETPRSIGSLLLVLVMLLHIWAAQWLLQPREPVTMAQPLMMEVSLVSAPGPKALTTPPAPPKPAEPPKPKKIPDKKPLKKKAPEKPKQAKPPKPEAIAEEQLPAPSPVESTAQSTNSQNSSATPKATASASKAPSNAEPYTEASVNANYGFNPPPKYPAVAKRRGWQGKVRLRVSVSAEGYSEAVAIHSSSGYEALDESAVEAVKKWRFNPAKRGSTAVASSVIVPINFTLER